MRHWTNALVAAVTGIVAATGASAQQHVLNMLVLSEDAPKIQKVADAYQAKHPDVRSRCSPRRGINISKPPSCASTRKTKASTSSM
jgi:hypothetical protein